MYDLDTIIDSIRNGQRKQALAQLCDSKYSLEDLFERLLEEQMPKEILCMYHIAVNSGYISLNPANLKNIL